MKLNTIFGKTQLNVFSFVCQFWYNYITNLVSVQDENEMFY